MPTLTDLNRLLATMSPCLNDGGFVFASVPEHAHPATEDALCVYHEAEGTTLICKVEAAERHALSFEGVYRCITLSVHSSLQAVGFLAAVATELAKAGIPCNAISAFYHDHIFIPANLAEDAMACLRKLSSSVRF